MLTCSTILIMNLKSDVILIALNYQLVYITVSGIRATPLFIQIVVIVAFFSSLAFIGISELVGQLQFIK